MYLPGVYPFIKIEHRYVSVFDFVGQRKAEERDQRHGHTKENEQGAGVAENVVKLFSHKHQEGFHRLVGVD